MHRIKNLRDIKAAEAVSPDQIWRSYCADFEKLIQMSFSGFQGIVISSYSFDKENK